MENRTTFLKRMSDAFLPPVLTNFLNDTIFFKINTTDVNGWTIMHFISGVFFGLCNKNIVNAFITHTLWEMFQFVAGDNKCDIETMIDISIDTIAFMCGFMIIR